jgi:hypothetical protein
VGEEEAHLAAAELNNAVESGGGEDNPKDFGRRLVQTIKAKPFVQQE